MIAAAQKIVTSYLSKAAGRYTTPLIGASYAHS